MKIQIVENIREKMKADNMYVREAVDEKRIQKAEKTIIVTPEVFSKIFSPERIKLMLKIRNTNFDSIYQLARALDRKYEAVYRDVKLLEGFGIITLKTKDNAQIPQIENIDIPVFGS